MGAQYANHARTMGFKRRRAPLDLQILVSRRPVDPDLQGFQERTRMTAFPGSPRLLKGAIIGLDPLNPLASVVVFQYNPDTMTRRLEPRAAGGDGGDRSEAYRLTGPPKETITLSVEVDAA